jgi:hypothetical protein
MPPELTLETLAKNISDINVKLGSFMADHTEEEKNNKDAKKAQDDKDEEEKKEAKRASRIAAIKKAMEEPTDEKKDAAIRKAMDDDHPKDHTAQDDEDKDKKEAKTAEEKEEKEHVASIIADAKKDYISKILTANTIMNPTGLKTVEARLKTASFSEIKKEWSVLQPAFEGATQQVTPQEKFVPYFANITPQDIDANTLTAASPDSDFAKFSTKELLEMSR